MNKIMPQRTFSPRTFMGDRGIILDNCGRVLKNESFSTIYDNEKKIVAPKPWKTSSVTHFSNTQFEEAGQEIQTIILNSFLGDFDELIGHNEHFESQTNRIKLNSSYNNLNNLRTIEQNINNNNNNYNNSNNNNNNNNSSSNNNKNNNNDNESTSKLLNKSFNDNLEYKLNINDDFTTINTLSIIDNYSQDSSSIIELKIPLFSQSPGLITEPITPPTRTHNPLTLNQAFSSEVDPIQYGAEIGLLSISPPLIYKH